MLIIIEADTPYCFITHVSPLSLPASLLVCNLCHFPVLSPLSLSRFLTHLPPLSFSRPMTHLSLFSLSCFITHLSPRVAFVTSRFTTHLSPLSLSRPMTHLSHLSLSRSMTHLSPLSFSRFELGINRGLVCQCG